MENQNMETQLAEINARLEYAQTALSDQKLKAVFCQN